MRWQLVKVQPRRRQQKKLDYKFKGDGGSDVAASATGDPASVFSVGSSGHLRQIQNVAQGRVASDSTDAVNGSQLYDVIKNLGFNVHGNGTSVSRINNNGAVKFLDSEDSDKLITSKVVDSGDDVNVRFNVKTSEITSSNGTATQTGAGLAKSSEVVKAINHSGFTLKANGKDGSFINNGAEINIAEGTNINVSKNGNTVTIKTVANPTFTSVNTGTLATTGAATIGGALTATGKITANGGLDLNNNKISKVGDGSVAAGSKDAVNGGQLHSVKTVAETANGTANTANQTANTANGTANTANNTANAAKAELAKGWNLTASKSTGGNLTGSRTDRSCS